MARHPNLPKHSFFFHIHSVLMHKTWIGFYRSSSVALFFLWRPNTSNFAHEACDGRLDCFSVLFPRRAERIFTTAANYYTIRNFSPTLCVYLRSHFTLVWIDRDCDCVCARCLVQSSPHQFILYYFFHRCGWNILNIVHKSHALNANGKINGIMVDDVQPLYMQIGTR